MTRQSAVFAIALAAGFAACIPTALSDSTSSGAAAVPVQHIRWRALAAAGDDSIAAFDNAVDAMTDLLKLRGVTRIDRFTSDPRLARAYRPIATVDRMAAALNAVRPGPGQGCLVFLTSHGSRQGLLMRDDLDHDRSLDPSALGRMLDEGCGSAPTVAIVSGCYSGIFIGRVTEAPNRIILTAARDDRTSFGCSAEEQYTYFDDCLLQSWPKSETWAALYRATAVCVRAKEREINAVPSEPQAYFGESVTNLALP